MKNMKTLRILTLAMLTAGAILQCHAANLLNNGDFNTGDLPDWWTYGADASQTTSVGSVYNYDGSPNAAMTSASETWRGAMGQNPVALPNTTYHVSFDYSATETPSWGSAALSITYYDSAYVYADGYVWAPLYDQQPAPNAPGEWLHYDGNFTTTANTANLNFEFDVWNWTTFHVDNVILEVAVVPEPSTAILGALGALGLLMLRRR